MPRTTPLYDVHVRLGGHMTEFGGWAMPLRYRSETIEHRAVRERAGLFDLSHMGQIEVSGRQAADALDHALVSNIAALRVGAAKYTLICADHGGILDDLIVYRLAEDRCLVVANAANAVTVAAALTRRADRFDAIVQPLEDRALLAVQGPKTVAILRRLAAGDISADRYYSIRECALAGRPTLVARTGYTGEDGFEIFCPASEAAFLWDAITEEGEPEGLLPAGLACRDTLRLEAGMPLYGNEITLTTTPFAPGLGRLVHLDKPEFIGRDALLSLSRSAPAQQLVGLIAEGKRVPRAGYNVLDAETGRKVGQVTSGAPSPTLRRPIAMAYIDSAVAEQADVFYVDVRGSAEPARRVDLPFYRRPTT